MKDVEGYIFGRDFISGQFGQGDFDEVVGVEFQTRFGLFAVDFNAARLDDFLEHNAAVVGVSPVEIFIEPAFLEGTADAKCEVRIFVRHLAR